MAELTSSERSRYAIPLVVAVTGHRDLVPDEAGDTAARVRTFLQGLRDDYPDRKLRLLSPLAEGADQLVADVALQMGIELIVPLPMDQDLYEKDFDDPLVLDRFRVLLSQANEVLVLPLARDNTRAAISDYGEARDRQYARLGIFLCAHCHILLALWDGKDNDKIGGTASVVRFHQDDIMPGYTDHIDQGERSLVDDESDLIYHIVVSRDRPDGAPDPRFKLHDCWWFSKDENEPRSRTMPRQHRLIFSRGNEFSADSIRFCDRIAQESWSLLPKEGDEALPDGVGAINHLYCIADWLAIHYQQKVMRTLKATHALAFLMGLSFIFYSDLYDERYYMVAFLVFFLLAAVAHKLAARGNWHRRYLDYRALAEGLRVQFYWAAAGVETDADSKFTHDMFLQSQDPELGWIRNVMRVAGTRNDAMGKPTPEGLDLTLTEWIGSETGGQLSYFRRKAGERIARSKVTDRLTLLSLLFSASVVLAIVIFGHAIPGSIHDPLIAGMGAILLLVGIRQGFAFSTAEKELIKQYEFMLRIFLNAHRRLEEARDDATRRRIIKSLGVSALNEHAEWILFHRDRTPDEGEIFMMGN